MTWYDLTPEQKSANKHWNDLPAEERAEVKRFVDDFIAELPLALAALGGRDPGATVNAVISGSWANGRATHISDYDIFVLRPAPIPGSPPNPVVGPGDPSILKSLIGYMVLHRQRHYNISRNINLRCVFANGLVNQLPNEIFGLSLDTGDSYATVAEAANASS